MTIAIRIYFLVTVIICFSFCCQQPNDAVPIKYGRDQCAFCRMTISNPQFGAELITDKGRVLMYDATECLVNQLNKEPISYNRLYAVPYDQPNSLIPVEKLNFLISPDFRSPMGANLTAYMDSSNLAQKYREQLIPWSQLLNSI